MSVFRKKPKKAPANGVPVTPANNPQTATPTKPVVAISDSERLAHIYRTLPITQATVDAQLLQNATWVRRKRLDALLDEFKDAAMTAGLYYSLGAIDRAAKARDEIRAMFEEIAGTQSQDVGPGRS